MSAAELKENYYKVKASIPENVELIVVSKTQSLENIQNIYDCGQRKFGENKVQELVTKYEVLPKDIEWHLIGHLQTNKVKYIAPFVHLIHSVDSLPLLIEINKQALKNNRIINCLLQIYIAKEETKFGLSFEEATDILLSDQLKTLTNINIIGMMGMATNTDNQEQILAEFKSLKDFFRTFPNLRILSMGMSSDYKIATTAGSTMLRIGSTIFGSRK
jgi:hypothetical protein